MSERSRTTVVTNASALVALLADGGPAGRWVAASVDGRMLAAPQLALFEAADVFRRHVLAGLLDESQAALAHPDLLALPLHRWPYAPLAQRAWQLRPNFTIYVASYIALGELLEATVITLDTRIANAPEARCSIKAYVPVRDPVPAD